ncbi:hypothetical protein [Salinivibrio sp. ML198]|uniref:hypothetical protein n=1 Tax=Salinivibrio sp. ML198 TaxID=1909458 RepID=UPI001301474D|nr:hypothetical protein [Salinivibrio sp. ML198]
MPEITWVRWGCWWFVASGSEVGIPTRERVMSMTRSHWRYSSARDYMGAPGLLAVCREW